MKNNKLNQTDLSVKERLTIYESVKMSLTTSEKTMHYLEKTGIYTKKGALSKAYK